jgi:hypothetical protein
MSENNPKRKKDISTVSEIPKISEQMTSILQDKLRELMNHSTTLVLKVASCNCKDKEKCGVYLAGRQIARLIDEIQELRPKE